MSKEAGVVKPQTVGNDLAHLGAVLAVARPAWGHDVSPAATAAARQVLKKPGDKMFSRDRGRRVAPEELGQLLELFSEVIKVKPLSGHMPKIVLFALFSTRRQAIRWDGLDEKCQAVLIRDMASCA